MADQGSQEHQEFLRWILQRCRDMFGIEDPMAIREHERLYPPDPSGDEAMKDERNVPAQEQSLIRMMADLEEARTVARLLRAELEASLPASTREVQLAWLKNLTDRCPWLLEKSEG